MGNATIILTSTLHQSQSHLQPRPLTTSLSLNNSSQHPLHNLPAILNLRHETHNPTSPSSNFQFHLHLSYNAHYVSFGDFIAFFDEHFDESAGEGDYDVAGV